MTAAPARPPDSRRSPATPADITACPTCRAAVRRVTYATGQAILVDLVRDPSGPLRAVKHRAGGRVEWRVKAIEPGEWLPDGYPRYSPHQRVDGINGTCPGAPRPVGHGPAAGPCSKCFGINPRRFGPQGSPLCESCGRAARRRWSPALRKANRIDDDGNVIAPTPGEARS